MRVERTISSLWWSPIEAPRGAAVPELPPEIDYVWLFLQFEPGPKEQNVWWVCRVEGRWHTALSW